MVERMDEQVSECGCLVSIVLAAVTEPQPRGLGTADMDFPVQRLQV